jgi:hypothetical protein
LVLNDIDLYFNQYKNISGIFLDEVSQYSSDLPYYAAIVSHLRVLYPGSTVVFNPGCIVPESYVQLADITVIFEGSFDDYKTWRPPPYVNQRNSSKVANIVYNVSSSVEFENMFKVLTNFSIGNMYITNYSLPNPYGELSPFFISQNLYISSCSRSAVDNYRVPNLSDLYIDLYIAIGISGFALIVGLMVYIKNFRIKLVCRSVNR